jgi:pyruvate formate lyase activating enzyme
MITGTIFDIRKYSIHDGPGIRTAVFFKGCPLDCWWCHNPEGKSFKPELLLRPSRCISCGACAEACHQEAIDSQLKTDRERCTVSGECVAVCSAEARELTGREVSVDQVLSELESDRIFYETSNGGITFSGGEPLAQIRFLVVLLIGCKNMGLHTAVDTSGFTAWQNLEKVRPLVNLFLYDIKLMDDNRHRLWTGVSNKRILANLQMLAGAGQEVLVRIPIIPGINNDEDNLRQTGEFLAALPRVPAVQLLPYHNIAEAKYAGLGIEYRLENIRPPSEKDMQRHRGLLEAFGLQVK